MLHTFVAHVQDKPGVLTRVASLFRRLNINIVSLTVGESERADVSRMNDELHTEQGALRFRAEQAVGIGNDADPHGGRESG